MFIFRYKIIVTALLFLFAGSLFSQNLYKKRERIKTIKKMKMLDILNLEEQKADKFLVIFNKYENRTEENRDALGEAADELREAMEKGEDSKISTLVSKIMKLEEEMFNIRNEKMNEIREFLNDDVKFAKLLIFERNFLHEMRKALDRMKHKRGRPDLLEGPR